MSGMPGRVAVSFRCRDDLHIHSFFRGFLHSDRPARLFILRENVAVVPGVGFNRFPRIGAIAARGDPAESESAVLIGGCRFVKLWPVAVLVRNQDDLISSYGLRQCIHETAFDLPALVAEQKGQSSRSLARDFPWARQDILTLEKNFLEIHLGGR